MPISVRNLRNGWCRCVNDGENLIATNEEIRKTLEYAYKYIPNFQKRLCYFALKKIRSYFFKNTIGEREAADAVQTVIQKILCGSRKWDKNKFPDFSNFIRYGILSYVRNERKKREYFVTENFEDDIELPERKQKRAYKPCHSFAYMPIENSRIEYNEMLESIRRKLKNDPVALFVLNERISGEKSNIKIAASLGCEVAVVERALKKIKHRLNLVRQLTADEKNTGRKEKDKVEGLKGN